MVLVDICFVLTMLVLLLFFCIFFMFMLRESDENNDQLPEKCVDLFWEIQRRAFEALWGEIRESFKEIREFLIHEVGDVSVFEDEAIFRVFVDVQREWRRCEEYFKKDDSQRYACSEGSAEADKKRFIQAAKMVDNFEDLVDQLTDMIIEKKRADRAGTTPNYVYKFGKGNVGESEEAEKKESIDAVCKSSVEEMNVIATPTKDKLVNQKSVDHNTFEQETTADGADEENIAVTAVTEETLDNFNLALNDVMEMLKNRLEEIRSSPSAAPLTNLEAELPTVLLKLLASAPASSDRSSTLSQTSSPESPEELSFSPSIQTSSESSVALPFSSTLQTSSKSSESLLLSSSLQIPSDSSKAPQDSDHVNPVLNKSNYSTVKSYGSSSDDDSDWNIVSDVHTFFK